MLPSKLWIKILNASVKILTYNLKSFPQNSGLKFKMLPSKLWLKILNSSVKTLA